MSTVLALAECSNASCPAFVHAAIWVKQAHVGKSVTKAHTQQRRRAVEWQLARCFRGIGTPQQEKAASVEGGVGAKSWRHSRPRRAMQARKQKREELRVATWHDFKCLGLS